MKSARERPLFNFLKSYAQNNDDENTNADKNTDRVGYRQEFLLYSTPKISPLTKQIQIKPKLYTQGRKTKNAEGVEYYRPGCEPR